MLQKALAIAWTHIYITYSDRGALVLMIIIPVALSTIIGLAFGQQFSEVDIEAAQVIVINQDDGATTAGGATNFGQIYVDVLTENDPQGLGEVLLGETGDDIAAARRKVEDGEANAVLVIPADFSANVTADDMQGQVDLYYNPGDNIAFTIITAVTEQITAQLNAGEVAQDVLLGDPPQAGQTEGNFGHWITAALDNGQFDVLSDGTIETAAQDTLTAIYQGEAGAAITLNRVNVEGEEQEFDSLQYFAPSMAVLFMTFAMAAGTRAILEEQANWTLQRIMTTPTPRWVYMLGKLLGTYASGVIQMTILLVVTPLVAVALGRSASVWGDNYLGLALVTLAVVGAATGLGLLLSAISESPRQADNYANAVVLVLAMVGGTFVPTDNVPVLSAISNISLNKWAIQGFTDLAADNATVGDILPNAGILAAMMVIFFGIALVRFNKRLDI